MPNIHIAYGSESGNAHTLAEELKDKLNNCHTNCQLNISALNALSLSEMTGWQDDDMLLIVTSTTGNGEAPDNASNFYDALVQKRMQQRMKADNTFIKGKYAVFGIGDINYQNFCGFSKVIDGLLDKVGATKIANRVDAGVEYEEFFEIWSNAVLDYCSDPSSNKDNSAEALQALTLQVDPDE